MKVEISDGELLDKISILQIKLERISDESKLKNIHTEYTELTNIGASLLEDEQVYTLYEKVKTVNKALWDLEDSIRMKEKDKSFGEEFIRLAREIYQTNDRRAEVKKEINLLTGSLFVEEKSYEQY
jgi:protein subunit release factor A